MNFTGAGERTLGWFYIQNKISFFFFFFKETSKFYGRTLANIFVKSEKLKHTKRNHCSIQVTDITMVITIILTIMYFKWHMFCSVHSFYIKYTAQQSDCSRLLLVLKTLLTFKTSLKNLVKFKKYCYKML